MILFFQSPTKTVLAVEAAHAFSPEDVEKLVWAFSEAKPLQAEALEAGTVKLVGTGYNSIIDNVSDLLENKDLYRQMSKAQNPYGDGKTSQSIVNILL